LAAFFAILAFKDSLYLGSRHQYAPLLALSAIKEFMRYRGTSAVDS